MSFEDDYEHLKIQLEHVLSATNNFSREYVIGVGGFGMVYKGELFLQQERRTVAIKRLDHELGQGDPEFWKEIVMLSLLKHHNLISLLHFCNEGAERILVYEYASRGSLDRYLGDPSLTWTQRLQICIGAASGLKYLHDPMGTKQRFLHRDVKCSNILLDEEWNAKVSDFGLSKIGPANQSRTYLISNAVGTPGYCDPLYFETSLLTKESDVYSFGVVLFEIMCGRLCTEYHDGNLVSILVPAWKNCYNENRLYDIIHHSIKEKIDQESLKTFSHIAIRCLSKRREERPSMAKIIKELKVALQQHKSHQDEPTVVKIPTSYQSKEEFDHRLKIQLQVIKSATNNFNDKYVIGRGGFGRVYKGELSLQEAQSITAIKRLDHSLGQGDTEFSNEIMILSSCKHENFVTLLHFCDESDERILVYEYVQHGSLDRWISDTRLSWTQRLKICIGVAKALKYLHDPMETHQSVIHRDIKSANILLDKNWTAKVSDFGLSTICWANRAETGFKCLPVGTFEYCDPVYRKEEILSKGCDVYSFGVVLFEVMCGSLCYQYKGKGFCSLVPIWIKKYEEKRLDDIICHGLKEQMGPGSLNTFSAIAYQCLKEDREERPTLSEIIKELEIVLEQQEVFEEFMKVVRLVVLPVMFTSQSQIPSLLSKGIQLIGEGTSGKIDEESMKTFSDMATQCLSLISEEGPSMAQIIQKLEALQQHISRQPKSIVFKTPIPHQFMEEIRRLKIQLKDVQAATNNFNSNKLVGRGAFGSVYKGELSLLEGPTMVAFKRLDCDFAQGNTEFWNEIITLSKCKHENVVSLLHFCDESDERILVYEYVSRGSLDRYVSNASLSWTQRLKICIGVANALKYLHDPMETQERILHRDIKSSNILLDENWIAKVSDFALSLVCLANQSETNFISEVVGTIGFIDPLYMEEGFLSKESDVYSFGVVLLEVMCGRLCYQHNDGAIDLIAPKWRKSYEEKRLDEIIPPYLKDQMVASSLNTFSTIVYQCLKRSREERPSMATIVKELEIALEQHESIL